MPLKPHVSSELTKIIDALETNDFVSKLVEIEEVKRKDSYLDVGLYADDSEQANHLRELQKSYPSYKYYQFDNEDVVEEIVKVKSVKDGLLFNRLVPPFNSTQQSRCDCTKFLGCVISPPSLSRKSLKDL